VATGCGKGSKGVHFRGTLREPFRYHDLESRWHYANDSCGLSVQCGAATTSDHVRIRQPQAADAQSPFLMIGERAKARQVTG